MYSAPAGCHCVLAKIRYHLEVVAAEAAVILNSDEASKAEIHTIRTNLGPYHGIENNFAKQTQQFRAPSQVLHNIRLLANVSYSYLANINNNM